VNKTEQDDDALQRIHSIGQPLSARSVICNPKSGQWFGAPHRPLGFVMDRLGERLDPSEGGLRRTFRSLSGPIRPLLIH
jgi:hypothetical protein